MFTRRHILTNALAAVAAVAAIAAPAFAQDYPTRPITFVVPFPAGGAADNVARLVAERMSSVLGQPMVVDNRGGAAGMIGATVAARAAPDGYTLLMGAGGPLAINIQVAAEPAYDPIKDFAPVTQLTFNDGIIVVHPDFPATTFAEFVAAVKAEPGKYSFASSGLGGQGHLNAERLKLLAGLDMVHVPYRGDAPAIIDVIAGAVPIMSTNLAAVAGQIEAGKLKPIAAMGPVRFDALPNLPTIAESGYPGFTAASWLALFAPAGTPPEVVAQLAAVWKEALDDPEYKAKVAALGSRPVASTPEELGAYLQNEIDQLRDIVKATIKPQ